MKTVFETEVFFNSLALFKIVAAVLQEIYPRNLISPRGQCHTCDNKNTHSSLFIRTDIPVKRVHDISHNDEMHMVIT